jgi:hypothetical protein
MRAIAVTVLTGVSLLVSACGQTSAATAEPAARQTATPVPTVVEAVRPACWASDGPLTIPGQGTVTIPGTTLSIDYSLPAAFELEADAADGVVGFGTPYGLPQFLARAPERAILPGSSGVAVVDVTTAIRHGSLIEQPRIGTDAETFLRDLDIALPYQNGVIDFEVADVAATQLAGTTAWSARVTVPDLDPPMWSHIDKLEGSNRDCAVEFGMANRVWVLDVGSSIVLVQAWAADDAALTAWLPDATQLMDTFRFRSDGS